MNRKRGDNSSDILNRGKTLNEILSTSLNMPRKPAKGIIFSNELGYLLRQLDPKDKFSKWVADMSLVLKENMFAGELVKKSLIPDYYKEKYGVDHLFRYEHPEWHRSCYFVWEGYCIILDIMTHEEYDRRFGYKTT